MTNEDGVPGTEEDDVDDTDQPDELLSHGYR